VFADSGMIEVEQGKILMYISSGRVALTTTVWRYDAAVHNIFLEHMKFWDTVDNDYEAERICEIKDIGLAIDEVPEELFDKLMESSNCHTEYNSLHPFQDFYQRIVSDAQKDVRFLYLNERDTARYAAYMRKYPITDSNAIQYNDIGYYLEQAECYKEAIYVLSKVLEKYPDRVVAYLNIADAYWGINDTEEAGKSYRKYLELMKSQGKDLSPAVEPNLQFGSEHQAICNYLR
jgi:tetratricopeptide (TPR) repeat protein